MNMLIVKKFGGTSVADKDRIFNVAKRCIRDYEAGNDVVVVLSAMGKYTDELIAKAKDINPNPPKRDGYALYNRRADVCVINGYGNGTARCSCCIIKCISGTNEDNKCVWKCPSEKD